jgi:hypothetical protein
MRAKSTAGRKAGAGERAWAERGADNDTRAGEAAIKDLTLVFFTD